MDSTYAPQSPDLSSFLSSPPKTQQPYNNNNNNTPTQGSYAPRSPGLPSFANPSPSFQQPNLHAYNHSQNQLLFNDGANDFAEYGSAQYMPPIPALPPSHSFPSNPNQLQHQNLSLAQPTEPPYFQRSQRQARSNISSYSDDLSPDQEEYISSPIMSSRGPRIKPDSSSTSYQAQSALLSTPAYKDPNPNNIEIKTKFPVARIKRIMQADEEVGKVAQVTPVAVSKALELFMIALVGGAAEKAKEKGGKKVTAQHLKSVVLSSPEQFDFLAEIVGRVSEAQEGAGGEGKKRKEKVEKDSDSSEEEKKPKKGRGRRKKNDD